MQGWRGMVIGVVLLVAMAAGSTVADALPVPDDGSEPPSRTTTTPAPAASADVAQPAAPPDGDGLIVPADEPIAGQYIVTLADGAGGVEDRIARLTRDPELDVEVLDVYEHALEGFTAAMDEADALALSTAAGVVRVEEDGIVHLDATQEGATWGLDRIDQRDRPLDGRYTYHGTGAGVRAYVIDSGIRTSHQEFGGRASVGLDLVGDGRDGQDCRGHGTHVAGTIAGATYGVAKQVELVAVRVFGCTGGSPTSRTIAAVEWVTANAVRPAVANMSLGGSVNATLNAAVANSVASGITYVVSAGNDDADACTQSPAAAPAAITVGSTTATDERSSFSNFGACVDLFAPGSEITSPWWSSDTVTNTISGTSMAAPHVTGVVALHLGVHRAATPTEVGQAVVAAATPGRVADAGTASPDLLLSSQYLPQSPSLSVVLDALPDADQDFSFAGCATSGGCSTFSLDDDGDSTLARRTTQGGLPVGTYTITLDPVARWTLTGIDCGDAGTVDLGERRATVSIAEGAHVTCTFTVDSASFTVVNDTQPDGPVDLGYTGCLVGYGCSEFTLDDDGDAALASARTFAGLAPGTYTITQDLAPGADLSAIECDGGATTDVAARRVTITVADREDVTCTFTSQARGSLDVTSDAVPDSPQDFSFSLCAVEGAGCAPVGGPLVLDDDSDPVNERTGTMANLRPGEYRITQEAVAGWGLVSLTCGSGDVTDLEARTANVTIRAGEAASCRFQVQTTAITIIQDAAPAHPHDFAYAGCRVGSGCSAFTLDDDDDPTLPDRVVATAVAPGTYTITQASPPSPWALAELTCTEGEVDRTAGRATVTIEAGDQVTCTFLDRLAVLTVVHDATASDPTDFSYSGCISGTALCSGFTLDDDDDPALPDRVVAAGIAPGLYEIIQHREEGWGLVDLSCTSGVVEIERSAGRAVIAIDDGVQATCTFLVRATSIRISLDTVPNTPDDVVFTGCRVPDGCLPFLLDDDDDPTLSSFKEVVGVADGTYRITMDPKAGWALAALDCTDGVAPDVAGRRFTVTVSGGEQVGCTFRVRDRSVPYVETFSAGMATPWGVTSGADGQIWVAGRSGEVISRIDPETGSPTTYPVGFNLRHPVAGPDGMIWVSAQTGSQVARIDPASGALTTFDVPGVSNPWTLAFGPEDLVWIAGETSNTLHRLDPATGSSTTFPMTGVVGVMGLTLGPDGNLWVTGRDNDTIGRVDPATGSVTVFPSTGVDEPAWIVHGPDGNLWVSGASGYARVDPATGAITAFDDGPLDYLAVITVGPDGNLWTTSYYTDQIARIDPATGALSAFEAPGLDGPWGIAAGPDGRLWATGRNNGRVARITLPG